MKATNWKVPPHKIKQFQEILGGNGGYFLAEPRPEIDCYRVDFEIGSGFVEFQKQWRMVNTTIVEKPKKKKTFFQKLLQLFQ